MTPTQTMLTRVESLKAGYLAEIERGVAYGQDSTIEYHQYRRLTTIECYLEERLGR